MAGRPQKNENANAEILGVVILIGIFAVMTGIISATTFSSPQPVKVPAASIEITSDTETVHIAHLGGEEIGVSALRLIVRRVDASGALHTWEPPDLGAWLGTTSISNGFLTVKNRKNDLGQQDGDQIAISLVWTGGTGESMLANWDPSSIYGPLGPPGLGDSSVPGAPGAPHSQPTIPQLPVNWSSADAVTANFTPLEGATVPAGTPLSFVDHSIGPGTITHWSWNFGDGTTLEATVPNAHFDHTYANEGTYSVTLTVSNPETGAHDTVAHTIHVAPPSAGNPLIDFTILPQDRGNRELTVTCLASTSINATAWQWVAIDGWTGTSSTIGPVYGNLMSNPRSPPFRFLQGDETFNNVCTVTLTVWSPYMQDPIVVTKPVTVGPPLHASFTPNVTTGYVSLPVSFLDTSTGVADTRLWDFGDGNTSTSQNPEHVYTTPGTYTVTLTLTGYDQTLPGIPPGSHNVTATATATIVVEDHVIANFTANVTYGEAPLTVAFTDLSTGGPTYWTWLFGDGGTSHEQHPVHTYTTNGIRMVSVVAEKHDPDSTDVMVKYIYIRVGPAVTADFTAAPTTVAAGDPVQFTDTSVSADPLIAPVNKWTWDFGDGTNSTAQHPSHIYTVPGTYTVTLTAENDYRTDTMAKLGYITVLPPVEARFIADATVGAMPMTVQFTDQSTENPTTWSWDFNSDSVADSTLQNPTFTYTAPGTYTVSLTASNAYDTNTTTKIGYIRVYGPVTASFTATPLQGLIPLAVRFTDTSTGEPDIWSWDFGDGTNSTEQHPNHTYTVAGNYTVRLTAANPYFSSTSAKNITAWPLTINATAGAGGTISPLGLVSVPLGGSQFFAITPNTGYHVANVKVDGNTTGAISNYTFTNINTNHTIAASFAINTYTITPSWDYAKPQDSISPDTNQTVTYGGASHEFTMKAQKSIVSVLIDGVAVSPVPTSPYKYTFTNVTADHTIYVKFGK